MKSWWIMNCGGQGDNNGGSDHNRSDNSGNSSSGERSDESEDGDSGVTKNKKRQTRRKKVTELSIKPQTGVKLALNLSASATNISTVSSTSSTSSSSSQIRRYGMGTDGCDSPSSALKLPRTLSTSVLKVKYRSSFWEKFWEERSKRDM